MGQGVQKKSSSWQGKEEEKNLKDSSLLRQGDLWYGSRAICAQFTPQSRNIEFNEMGDYRQTLWAH